MSDLTTILVFLILLALTAGLITLCDALRPAPRDAAPGAKP